MQEDPVTAADIADFLGCTVIGPDAIITKPAALFSAEEGTLVFASRFDESLVSYLNSFSAVLALVIPDFAGKLSCPHIVLDNPRLAFARVVATFFAPDLQRVISSTARIGNGVKIGEDVAIGDYCVVGDGASIGDGTVLRHHVVVSPRVRIGEQCWIGSHVVIGELGFGFAFDEVPLRIPHLGSVVIGDNVEIGAGTTIAQGTLENTVIEDSVKIDDQVFIAHNVRIGRSTMIVAHAEINGSCRIGQGSYIGPNATIRDQVTVGEKATVSMGAVVTKDVSDGMRVSGNFAIEHRNLLAWLKDYSQPHSS